MDNTRSVPKRGRSVRANANMGEVKCAHIPKFCLTNVNDEELKKLARLADRLRQRANINKYVFGK